MFDREIRIARRRLVRFVIAAATQPREPEIHHPCATVVRDEHVVGFEIAMHEPGVVRGSEPLPRRDHHRQDLAPRSGALLQPLAQRDAIDELHRDKHRLALTGQRADVVHRDHVRMREPRERLRFADEPRLGIAAGATGPAVVRLQELDRDLAIELGVERAIDDAHAARAQHVEHDVAADQRPTRQIIGGRGRVRAFGPGLPDRARTARAVALAAGAVVVGHSTGALSILARFVEADRQFCVWVQLHWSRGCEAPGDLRPLTPADR